jgi:hypothetical protein
MGFSIKENYGKRLAASLQQSMWRRKVIYSFVILVSDDNAHLVTPSCPKRYKREQHFHLSYFHSCVWTVFYSISHFTLLFHHICFQIVYKLIHKDKSYVGSMFLISVCVFCVAEYWK